VSGRRRSSGIRAAGLALLCACLLSGCVSLQQDSTVTKVQESDAGAAQVQIWPSPPSSTETASEIVSGFLEAARSGASNQKIAGDYLTSDMKKEWQGEQNTVIVLADYSESAPQNPDAESVQDGPNGTALGSDDDDGAPVVVEQVDATELGQLDASGLYSAQSKLSATYNFTVKLTKDGYRIAQLPQHFGVLMERSDFGSFYARHTVYYQNPQPGQNGRLVPTQIYLPSVNTDQQAAAQVAEVVVNGVPDPLSAVMRDAVSGARYLRMQVDGNGHTTVQIASNGACAKSAGACDQLAQQLAQTLGALSTKYVSVQVTDTSSGQTTPPETPRPELSDYGLGQQVHSDGDRPFYAISPTGDLEELNTSGAVVHRSIPFGDSKVLFRSVTEQPGGTGLEDLALVGADATTLYEPRRQNGVEQLATVYPPAGGSAGGKVGRPGWDSFGNLWFTVVLPDGVTSVYRYDGRSLDQVVVSGLNAVPEEVVPAPDGDQIAVRYAGSAGEQIAIAAVTRTADSGYALNMAGAQVVASSWKAVTDFDWYDENSLAVLGVQPGSGELGLYKIYTDGTAFYDSLTSQPVQASPPSQASGFVWTAAGQPIATAPVDGKNMLYTLSVEGQDAQPLSALTGTSPTY
jgi:hypothetical protein